MDYVLHLTASIIIVHVCMHSIYILTDTDECARKIDNCSQNCRNIPGSFECGCDVGYELSSDGMTCQG